MTDVELSAIQDHFEAMRYILDFRNLSPREIYPKDIRKSIEMGSSLLAEVDRLRKRELPEVDEEAVEKIGLRNSVPALTW